MINKALVILNCQNSDRARGIDPCGVDCKSCFTEGLCDEIKKAVRQTKTGDWKPLIEILKREDNKAEKQIDDLKAKLESSLNDLEYLMLKKVEETLRAVRLAGKP
jgi:hypothetical protein